jgi:hypothetical protein
VSAPTPSTAIADCPADTFGIAGGIAVFAAACLARNVVVVVALFSIRAIEVVVMLLFGSYEPETTEVDVFGIVATDA